MTISYEPLSDALGDDLPPLSDHVSEVHDIAIAAGQQWHARQQQEFERLLSAQRTGRMMQDIDFKTMFASLSPEEQAVLRERATELYGDDTEAQKQYLYPQAVIRFLARVATDESIPSSTQESATGAGGGASDLPPEA